MGNARDLMLAEKKENIKMHMEWNLRYIIQ